MVINLKENKKLKIGKLGNIYFKKGFYFYIGSALNGLEQRIQRHLRNDKKKYWHIDYLLSHAQVKNVFYIEGSRREECNIAKKIDEKLLSIPGFGCTDCKCKSHLFYNSSNDLSHIITDLKMLKYFNANT